MPRTTKREFTTLGEAGLRLTPAPGMSIPNATCFEADIVGCEANVAAILARLGRSVGWLSSLPDTDLGVRVEGTVRAHGVDTSRVVWTNGARVSLFYWERSEVGNGRPHGLCVLCDGADSAFCRLTPGQIDWDYLLDTRWLHVTATAMGASPSARAVVEQAVGAAHAAGVSVSLDANHFEAQWTAQEARSALLPLLDRVDLLFCTARDARAVFELTGPNGVVLDGLAALTSGDNVVMNAGQGGVFGLSGGQRFHHGGPEVVVVDQAGTSDALAAGVLHGLLEGDFALGLAYGKALTTFSMSRWGGQVGVTANELVRLAEHVGSEQPR